MATPRPPFSTDLLADLHADNVAPDLSDRLWPQIRRDPEALRFLRSLDDVTTELRNLGREPTILHPMPDQVTARLDALLDQLATGGPACSGEPATPAPESPEHVATVHRLPLARPAQGPPSTRPLPALDAEHPDTEELEPVEPAAPIPLRPGRRRWRWLAAAAAAVVVVAGSLITVDAMRSPQSPPTALPTPQSGDDVDISDDLPVSQLLGAMGRRDLSGPLADHAALVGCVNAAGLDRSILGATNATYHGKSAVLILLTGPSSPKITALIVGRDCGPGNAHVLVQQDIG
ncbi:hypothetical protein NRB20_60940 [Nocardia sp. RB20]|uniref:Anti-sigma-M factor RsmA n=2 Tax=Nocardia macrotermitis TaxID=2585198 RepID=A0A7K0DB17_9NOCA|nr:hypothetical protein [Nocardia macrotermitis]